MESVKPVEFVETAATGAGVVAAPSRARTLAKTQAVSGLVFSLFACVHLINTALATRGPAAYDGFQRSVRSVYQVPLLEILTIFAPLLVHIGAGIARMRLRKGERAPSSLRMRLHRYSGWFLLAVIFGHIAATRLPVWWRDAYPEFAGLSWTFMAYGWFFYPYFALLGLCGTYHLFTGVQIALPTLGVKLPAFTRRGPGLWLPIASASLLVLLGVASLGGLVFHVPYPSQHPFVMAVNEVLHKVGLAGTEPQAP